MQIAYLYSTNDVFDRAILGGEASHIKGATDYMCADHKVTFFSNAGVEGLNPRIEQRLLQYTGKPEIFKEIAKMKYSARLYQEVHDLCVNSGVDLIYQRYSAYDWTGMKLAQKFKVPLFLEFNSSEYWKSVNNWDKKTFIHLLKYSEDVILQTADRIFVVSEVLRDQLVKENGVKAERVILNPNGVDVEKFSSGRFSEAQKQSIRTRLNLEGKRVIGFTGSFAYYHGITVIVEAMKRLIPERQDLAFLLIGQGEMFNLVKETAEECGISDNVRLVGRIPHGEIPLYLSICDIFLCPNLTNKDKSDFFGSPTKLFEYMAMGQPVIASAVGQLKNIIRHGENGYLIAEGDSEALARYILESVDNQVLAQKIGDGARKTVTESYTWQENARRILDQYAAVTNQR